MSHELRRLLARNSVFAVAASLVSAIGIQNDQPKGSASASTITGSFLGALILVSILRIPAALMEHYITSIRLRKWIYWPHGIAMAIAVSLVISERTSDRQLTNILSFRDVTYAILIYLVWSFLLIAGLAVAICLQTKLWRTSTHKASDNHEPLTNPPNRATAKRHQISRDAAVPALSIVVGIAGVVQGLDFHNLIRTIIAFAVGGIGLYILMKLPESR